MPFLYSSPGRTFGSLWAIAAGGKAAGPDPFEVNGASFLGQFKVSVFGLANQWTFSSIPFSEMSFLLCWESPAVGGKAAGPDPFEVNGASFLGQFKVSVFGLANQWTFSSMPFSLMSFLWISSSDDGYWLKWNLFPFMVMSSPRSSSPFIPVANKALDTGVSMNAFEVPRNKAIT